VTGLAAAGVITIAITTANRGRWMKMLKNRRCSVPRRDVCRNDLARTDLLNTLHDYEFASLEPLRDDNIAALFGACGDASLLDLFCVVDHQNIVARLIHQYGRLRHEKRFNRRPAFHNYADDTARDEQPLAVW